MKKEYALQIEFTNNCNFQCKFCPQLYYKKDTPQGNKFDRAKGFMTGELFEIALNNANKYAKRVRLGYFGEQLLHPKAIQFLNSFPKDRDYRIELNSNWSLFTKNHVESLRNMDLIEISLDSSNSELWDQLCPGEMLDLDGNPSSDRYATMKEKMEYWFNLKNRPPTNIAYVTSMINEFDKEKFVREWIPKLRKNDRVFTKSVLSYGGVVNDPHMINNKCTVPDEKRFTISWNGDCTICNLDVNVALNVGNLLNENDMLNIINSDLWKKRILEIKNRQNICANCFDANNWTENKFYYGERD